MTAEGTTQDKEIEAALNDKNFLERVDEEVKKCAINEEESEKTAANEENTANISTESNESGDLSLSEEATEIDKQTLMETFCIQLESTMEELDRLVLIASKRNFT